MPTRNRGGPSPDAAHTGLAFERIIFFSDAVMAIAITLLAIDLRVPEIAGLATTADMAAHLVAMWPRFLSFIVSFGVVAVYWNSHHRNFNLIRRYDGRLIVLNLLFLLCITCMPFIAGLLGQYPAVPLSLMVYAGAVAATGYCLAAIWWYATDKHRLVDADLDSHFIRSRNVIGFIGPTMFVLSIPAALVSSTLAIAVWCLSPFLSLMVLRWLDREPLPRKTA